jgi:hypothetical protein
VEVLVQNGVTILVYGADEKGAWEQRNIIGVKKEERINNNSWV